MTQEHGQPANQNQPPVPGYGPPQTPPGGYPVYAHGQQPYPQQPYPQQQQPYGYQDKPGGVTGAAVLGYIQAGLTLITTGLLFVGLVGGGGDALGWLIALAQLAGLVLLIFGSVQLMSGTSRNLYVAGAIVELVISAYYFISIVVADTEGIDLLEDMQAAASVIPVVFAVMPAIGLILALNSGTTRYLQARRGH